MVDDDRAAAGDAGHDHLSPAAVSGHVVIGDAAHEHDEIGLGERGIERHGRARRGGEAGIDGRVAVVADPRVSVSQRIAEDHFLILLQHFTVLPRGGDPRDLCVFVDRSDALPHGIVHRWSLAPAARHVGHADGDLFGVLRQLFELRRTDGVIKRFVDRGERTAQAGVFWHWDEIVIRARPALRTAAQFHFIFFHRENAFVWKILRYYTRSLFKRKGQNFSIL